MFYRSKVWQFIKNMQLSFDFSIFHFLPLKCIKIHWLKVLYLLPFHYVILCTFLRANPYRFTGLIYFLFLCVSVHTGYGPLCAVCFPTVSPAGMAESSPAFNRTCFP